MSDSELPDQRTSPVIDAAAYSRGVRVATIGIDALRDTLQRDDQFVWLGLYEPDEALLRHIQEQCGLHDLAVEDAYKAHQRPKLEVYGDSLFVVLRTAHRSGPGRALEFGETHVFVGRNYIVTVRHGSLRPYIGVRHRCEATPHLLMKGPGYVLYSLMDFVVDQYLPVVQQLEEDVQELEEVVFDPAGGGNPTLGAYQLKRTALELRRAVSPLVDVCNRLMRFDLPLIPDDTRPYFRDVYDHVLRVNEIIDVQRELLTTALEAHLALVSVSQNEHMKRITAWAAMIAIPTMIAGIYGMNFAQMPELHWQYGYYLSLAVMAVSCIGLYFGFRRSGWL